MNRMHPQTLSMAVSLGYIGVVFSVLSGTWLNPIGLVAVLLGFAATVGIANDKKVAWYVAVVLSSIGMLALGAYVLLSGGGVLFSVDFLIGIVSPVAYFALLIHPISRSYVKTWFQ
jgi:hypothetical protein